MAIDNKYGKVEIVGIPEDEPIFILRAQDMFALPTICDYRSRIEALDRVDDPILRGFRQVVGAFLRWKNRKIPD